MRQDIDFVCLSAWKRHLPVNPGLQISLGDAGVQPCGGEEGSRPGLFPQRFAGAAGAAEDGEQPAGLVGMANPWEDMTAEQLQEASGLTFFVPEGAENVIYRYLRSEGLIEMQFTLDGNEYCARMVRAQLQNGELMDISGMYFAWENEEEVTVGHCKGTIGQAQTGSEEYVELCLWYDVVPGLMYSLSVYTTDLDGLDLTAVAQQVFIPAQGND